MKTTKLFVAALALLSVLSCQKEAQENIINPDIKGGQLITCGFANNDPATKTTLDGLTPKWAVGDKIMLYDDSSNIQELTLAASGTASSTTGIIDGKDATKFTFAKPSGWENVYAIYPSSACLSGFSASNPTLNFAGQDGTFAKANICAAVDISDTMSFKNVGAILKFPSKPATVTDILIPVAGLAKDYKVSFSGGAPSLTSVVYPSYSDISNSKSYSIGSGTETIYIGVPAENIAAGNNIIYQDSNKDILGSYKTTAANNIETNKIYTLPAIEANGTIPAGMLSKKAFSVSETKKVYFSKGNLQATVDANGTPTAWKFADDQYSYIGKAKANTTIGTEGGEVDLFGWSTDAANNNWGIHTKEEPVEGYTTGYFKDWGANAISNGGNIANLWSTMKLWKYLLRSSSDLYGRTDDYRFAKAMVNDVKGLIIFPDGYTGTTSGRGIAEMNKSRTEFPTSSIGDQTWSEMESAGCVFLPAAGKRSGLTVEGDSEGYYWETAAYSESSAYCYEITNDHCARDYYARNKGFSVRLVYDAQ